MKKAIAASLVDRTGLRRLLHGMGRWRGLVVLNYHRIGHAVGTPYDHGLWSASEETFSEQMRFMRRHMDLVDPADLAQLRDRARGRYAMVTFDDGYRDNYEAALPILRHEGVRATFFVATGFIDQPSLPWWDEIAWMVRTSRQPRLDLRPWLDSPVEMDEPDRECTVRTLLRVYKTLPGERLGAYLDAVGAATGSGRADPSRLDHTWMTWNMLREMRDAGMTIGGHTVSHPVLANMNTAQQRDEILQCGKRLAEELGQPMDCFSYPVGYPASFDKRTREVLAEAGVRWAFSYYGGCRHFDDWDPYDIRRVAVEAEVTAPWFRSIMTLPAVFA
ncbi:MAG TPA: polysaccharide deacetylase family protein [Rhodanobacter sp.]|nr:polysaccharide deacetylase family protein [Rhodanobacter sp.]